MHGAPTLTENTDIGGEYEEDQSDEKKKKKEKKIESVLVSVFIPNPSAWKPNVLVCYPGISDFLQWSAGLG